MKLSHPLAAVILAALSAISLAAQSPIRPGTPANTAPPGLETSSVSIPGIQAAAMPRIANVEDSRDVRVRRVWIVSLVAMVAATSADAATSWNKREGNSILASNDGTFGERGLAIKTSVAAAVLVPQVIFRKRKDWRGAFAIANFVEAGVFTGAAIHNVNTK